MDYVTPEVAKKIELCVERLRSGSYEGCPIQHGISPVGIMAFGGPGCGEQILQTQIHCPPCWRTACLEYIRENAPRGVDVGDLIIFLDKKTHDEEPEYFPVVGTVGKVLDSADPCAIQWPVGTTSEKDKHLCLSERFRRISNLTKSKEENPMEINGNCIILNGKRAELTEEQLKKLGIEQDKLSVFARARDKETYMFIGGGGDVPETREDSDEIDDARFAAANYVRYCPEGEKLLKQRALHEILSRRLWRFAMENGRTNKGKSPQFTIEVGRACSITAVTVHNGGDRPIGSVSFADHETAKRAVDEIVQPFLAEHPDFEW